MQEGVLRHGFAQRLRNVHVAVLIRRVIPGAHAPREDLVRQIAIKFEIVADVIIEHAGIRSGDGGDAGIKLRVFAGGIAVNAEEPGINATNGAPITAQQFFGEAHNLDAEIGAFNVIG